MKSDVPSPPYVLLADVIGSRDITDRSTVRDTLRAALDTTNERFEDAVVSDLELLKGIDEFGCVLSTITPLYEVLATLLDRIHPITVRVAVVSGEIDVGAPGDPIAELDGPAFHRAGELLDTVARNDRYVGLETGHPGDPLAAVALNLFCMQREQLTDRQVEVIRAYERYGTQQAAADALDVPQQTVSRTLQRADYQRVTGLRAQFRSAVDNLYG